MMKVKHPRKAIVLSDDVEISFSELYTTLRGAPLIT
jgi:hypothetical protein